MSADRDSEYKPKGSMLPVRVELIRESDRSVKASAYVDVMSKTRLVIPDDWPDLPGDLPEFVDMELDQGPLGLNLEILIRHALDNAVKAVFEGLFDLDLDEGGEAPPAGNADDTAEAVVMSAEEVGLEEVVMTPEELGLEPVEDD